ncbi:hypothetical protein M422DRAFT_188739 [Sphaerobolus stellatus SS14]|uniref:SWR1-complex protein 5 n=1 Tax=Sphaerobolus stellatus (strain SS14) TaxID=990650 RepID=A0A0C9U4R3_SPHS4|nr:hypothetical protein M422DRAFT_188739 [Sphaerobolus stellatus SS14]
MVKIVKKYRFAGEDVTKVEEVAEDSPDAKSWPLWDPVTQSAIPNPATTQTALSPSTLSFSSTLSSSSTLPPSTNAPGSDPTSASTPTPNLPRPRKTRKSLDSMFASAKVKKLTTLDKSAMDWKQHVDSSKDIKDDLEANRRGGGYLEKVEFLRRVDERVEEVRESVGTKRRR